MFIFFALTSKLFHITNIGYCVPKIKEARTLSEVAGYNGGSVGAVLVLFILLVIILSAFGFGIGV